MTTKNVIIIGSGPAGYTAAIYLARAGLKPLVFAGKVGGGQLMWTTKVENFPGFPEGKIGTELMGDMRAQAERFGAEIVESEVSWVDFSKRPFLLGTGEKPKETDKYREKLMNIDKSREISIEVDKEKVDKNGEKY